MPGFKGILGADRERAERHGGCRRGVGCQVLHATLQAVTGSRGSAARKRKSYSDMVNIRLTDRVRHPNEQAAFVIMRVRYTSETAMRVKSFFDTSLGKSCRIPGRTPGLRAGRGAVSGLDRRWPGALGRVS